MNWKLKAHALAVISRLPGGKRVYHRLQSWLGTNKLDADEYLRRALEVVELVRESGANPFQGTYLEIGTGWRPFVPFLLYLVGAERILTFDINPWLNLAYARQTHESLAERLPLIAERLALPLAEIRQRYDATLPHVHSLAELLKACRIEYRCPGDARQTGLADESVDFVCSSNVLEHVPPDVLRAIHEESLRILKPGGVAIHRFNPADHFSFVDKSITSVNFLRYSPEQWRWYGGSGLAYHNRLRCVQYEDMVKRVGFSVVASRVRMDQDALTALRKGEVPLHTDFRQFAPEELAGEYMWLVGKKNGKS
jgi:SAM-dependent methyltransferase